MLRCCPSVKEALSKNLLSALRLSLLLLPERFNSIQLYTTIAGISYHGDFRMILGEDRNKVNKLVIPNVERFHSLYGPLFSSFDNYLKFDREREIFTQDTGPRAQLALLSGLPTTLASQLSIECEKTFGKGNGDFLKASIKRPLLSKMLLNGVDTIVKRSSRGQSVKGLLTAGLRKSILYSSRKLVKSFI